MSGRDRTFMGKLKELVEKFHPDWKISRDQDGVHILKPKVGQISQEEVDQNVMDNVGQAMKICGARCLLGLAKSKMEVHTKTTVSTRNGKKTLFFP